VSALTTCVVSVLSTQVESITVSVETVVFVSSELQETANMVAIAIAVKIVFFILFVFIY
jgi:hypothetical protein